MWMYEKTADNSARFVLGTKGNRPLVCFGINPSTAEPNALDPTLTCVQRVSRDNPQFDSFIMFNVYPQRATNPNDLHAHFEHTLKHENERHISMLVAGKKLLLWAAWGALIEKRPYLRQLVHDIVTLPALEQCTWVSRGMVTKKGHPHHPLYVKSDCPLEYFNMEQYIKNL